MDRVALDLGIVQIYWYSIFVFLGMLLGCAVIYKEAKKRNVSEDFLINLTFNALIFGIIGARLYYVAFNLDYYLARPLEILEIWNGGLAIHGGIFAGLLATLAYCKSKKENAMRMLDMIVVGVILGQAIGRWGNFFNQEAYGAITTLEALQAQALPKFIIDGMYILGEYRQPTFLYESIGCLIGFIILILIRLKKTLKRGTLTASYLIIYGGLRFVIESMRSDSLMIGPLKIAQLVSICFILIGVIILLLNLRKGKEDKYLYRKDPKEVAIEQIVYFN